MLRREAVGAIQVMVAEGTLLDTLRHKSGVRMVAYSPNGQLLASGGYDGTVTFWNLASREHVSILDAREGYAVSSLVFSHDGKTLITSCFEQFANFDARNAKAITKALGNFSLDTFCLRKLKHGDCRIGLHTLRPMSLVAVDLPQLTGAILYEKVWPIHFVAN